MATFDQHANLTLTTVATAPSPATTGLSLTVAAGTGANFPTVPFNCTAWPSGTDPTKANAEIIRVTSISTDTFTITRAQEGSTAQSIAVGWNIGNTETVKTFEDIEGLFPVAVANGGTGSTTQNFVDLTTAQTIAGDKTFSNNIILPGGQIQMGSGSGGQDIINTNGGSGLILAGSGNGVESQLRIVANNGGWSDNINTAYFQIESNGKQTTTATFISGTYGSDVQFARLQFCSYGTTISSYFYNATPVPTAVLEVIAGTSNQLVLKIIGYSSQTDDLTEWQNSAGTVLAKVDYLGNIITTGTITGDSLTLTTPLAITDGGTGNTTGTATAMPYTGLTGTVPTWNQNTTGSAADFTGSLAGDVTGTQGATVLSKIDGTPLSITTLTSGQVLEYNGTDWVNTTLSSGGSVTSVSVTSANGFAGTVATDTTTPAITMETTVTGILYGDGTSIAAASASEFPTLNQNTTGTASNVTGTVAVTNGGTGTTLGVPEGISIVVAASDAPAKILDSADYKCTGTADNLVIMDALNALPTTGGVVLLSPGTFNVTGTISLTEYQMLKGAGINATTITSGTNTGFYLIHAGNAQSTSVQENSMVISDMTVTASSTETTYDAIWIDGGGEGTSMVNVKANQGKNSIRLTDLDRCYFNNIQAENPNYCGINCEQGVINTWGTVTFINPSVALNQSTTYGWLFSTNADQTGPTNFDRVSIIGALFYSSPSLTGTVGMQLNVGCNSLKIQGCLFEENNIHLGIAANSIINIETTSFIGDSTVATDLVQCNASGQSFLTFTSCAFQQATNAFNGVSGYSVLNFLGSSKNMGTITNLFTGGFGGIFGTDTPFAGNGELNLGNSSDYFNTGFLQTLELTNPLNVAYGGTGVATVPADGELLIGNGSDYTAATLTAGTNVTITNGAGAITISASGGSSGGGGFEGTFPSFIAPNKISLPEYAVYHKVYASNSGTYTQMQTFINAVNATAPLIYLAVYLDSTGALLGSGSFSPTVANSFYSVTLSSAVTFTAGDAYWLMINNTVSDSTTYFLEMPTSGNTALSFFVNGQTTLPSTLPTTRTAFNEVMYLQMIA